MFSAVVSGHGLKNEIYSCVAHLFSGHGLKNEIYSLFMCSALHLARLFLVMD